jgi:2-dehydropantoate 2-reductase
MLIQALGKAGFDARVSNNIKETVWKKLLINAVINPLTAILRIRNGELLESRERIDWMRELFQEGLAVARAEGVNLSPGLWEELLSVCRRTANNHSSMLQDIMNGRRTEMEWINGSLLKAGARHGLELPAHAAVVRRIREMERDNRG